MSKQGRYRGLKPHPEVLGVKVLEQGEGTRVYRVRAPETILDRFGTMTAEERGAFIVRAYTVLDDQGKG